MAETHKGFGLLFEMGCGKTLTAIMIAGTAYQMGKVEKVLVVAPTSVCSVWPKDFAEFADFKANIKVLLGDKNRRLKLLNDLDNFPFKALKVAVINYESTWREGIFDALYEWNADMIICDESQRIKSHDAEQSKAMHKLGDQAKYKLILSGTPVQNNAIDLYSQYRFLDPTIFGTNFYQFRNRYAIMGGFNRHQIVGYKDLDQLIQKEHSIAYRVTKDEALDLPEQTFLQRYITMSAKEKNIYDRIKRESFAELESGGQISATTVLTKLLRLQQFTGGFLVADGEEKPELVSKGKLNALEEIVDDYVVDAVDTMSAKLALVTHCHAAGVPIICAMGAGNKLDPTGFQVADLAKTKMDPLARVMRRELKKRGIHHLKVVYSEEPPIPTAGAGQEETDHPGRRSTPGSVAFVPSVVGLILAGEVIKDLIKTEK